MNVEEFREYCLSLKGVEEMVEVYYNSRQFDRTIAHIMEQYDSPYRFFLELSEYYERKGLSGIGHSRIARYEILRAFLEEKKLSGPDNDQCMVLDLYARENLKSRPAFAPDLSPYKDKRLWQTGTCGSTGESIRAGICDV